MSGSEQANISLPSLWVYETSSNLHGFIATGIVFIVMLLTFVRSQKQLGAGEGGKNEDDEYFDLLPNI